MDDMRPATFTIPPAPKICLYDNKNVSTEKRRRPKTTPYSKVSEAPPHTKFAVIPSRAVTDPRINSRKPLLLLLAALGVHASVHGICYPSQRRLALLCNKSRSWVAKYLAELKKLGYVRRLAPPKPRGPRSAHRLQILWRGDDALPEKESKWEQSPWCWHQTPKASNWDV